MEELNIKEIQKDLPQLIVALDSLDDTANYIHINDAKEGVIYYCPCCKGIIKPRAYKNDKEYQYQAHFYHDDGGCNEETYIHYICKTWLFESGCKFKVDNEIYIVDKIETEKTYHTQFGDYRPDITVHTTIGKIFFFEIKHTNKKTEDYIPKWDELENDIVEVDTRYFINQKYKNDIPVFKLIYSDGECYIKSYTKKDYDDVIAKRKMEWKRQDKLNYKMMWEKLDWFWIEVQKYKNDNSNPDLLLNAFKSLSFYDIENCWNILNKMSCCKAIRNDCRNIVNNKSSEMFKLYLDEIKNKFEGRINISYNCQPKNNLYISFSFTDEYKIFNDSYQYYDKVNIENKAWIILPSKIIELINEFKIKENHIANHCNNVDEIKKIITWNKAPMLYDNYLFGSYLDKNKFSCRCGFYIEDATKVISEINNNIIDEVSKIYLKKYCSSINDVKLLIDKCLKKYETIYNVVDRFNYGSTYGFSYKGNRIILFEIDNRCITYKNKSFVYELSRENDIKEFLNECIDDGIIDFNSCATAIDMITDIRKYSNETWEFNVDIETKSIIIKLNYTIPYYESYIKRMYADTKVIVDDMFNENFHFVNYHNEVKRFLDNRIAPTMEKLIDNVIYDYNSTHINSALCKATEVKRIQKEECECQNI